MTSQYRERSEAGLRSHQRNIDDKVQNKPHQTDVEYNRELPDPVVKGEQRGQGNMTSDQYNKLMTSCGDNRVQNPPSSRQQPKQANNRKKDDDENTRKKSNIIGLRDFRSGKNNPY